MENKKAIKLFNVPGLFCNRWKYQKKLCLPDVLKEYRKRPVTWNGLKWYGRLESHNIFQVMTKLGLCNNY